jgi:hypothetical protein
VGEKEMRPASRGRCVVVEGKKLVGARVRFTVHPTYLERSAADCLALLRGNTIERGRGGMQVYSWCD